MGFRLLITKAKSRWYARRYKNLRIGSTSLIEGPIEVGTSGIVLVGENTRIRRWSCFRPYGGKITIGNNCTVNSFSHISGNGNVEIGNNVLIATQCVIVSANHNFDNTDIPISMQGETKEKIVIEDDCWLGAGVKVLAGVTIHKGSVIGGGSVVTHDIPPYSIVVGVPGKVIKSRR